MKYQIWSEGYVANGDKNTAMHHGEYEADSFKEACILWGNELPDFDSDRLTYWGCRLFDNEADARKSFG